MVSHSTFNQKSPDIAALLFNLWNERSSYWLWTNIYLVIMHFLQGWFKNQKLVFYSRKSLRGGHSRFFKGICQQQSQNKQILFAKYVRRWDINFEVKFGILEFICISMLVVWQWRGSLLSNICVQIDREWINWVFDV